MAEGFENNFFIQFFYSMYATRQKTVCRLDLQKTRLALVSILYVSSRQSSLKLQQDFANCYGCYAHEKKTPKAAALYQLLVTDETTRTRRIH